MVINYNISVVLTGILAVSDSQLVVDSSPESRRYFPSVDDCFPSFIKYLKCYARSDWLKSYGFLYRTLRGRHSKGRGKGKPWCLRFPPPPPLQTPATQVNCTVNSQGLGATYHYFLLALVLFLKHSAQFITPGKP